MDAKQFMAANENDRRGPKHEPFSRKVHALGRCGTCKWWDESWTKDNLERDPGDPEIDTGECRRFPPTQPTGTDEAWNFPMTWRREWCGEHSPND